MSIVRRSAVIHKRKKGGGGPGSNERQMVHWGDGSQGRQGSGYMIGEEGTFPVPQVIPGFEGIQQMAGYLGGFWCLTKDGSVYGSGANGFAPLGLGDTRVRISPTKLVMPDNQKAIALGRNAAGDKGCALLADGTVAAWSGIFGESGLGSTITQWTPFRVYKEKGTTKYEGDVLKNIVKLRSGYHDYMMLDTNNELWRSGQKAQQETWVWAKKQPQSDLVHKEGLTIVDFSPSFHHTVLVLNDGTMRVWGQNEITEMTPHGQGLLGMGFELEAPLGVEHLYTPALTGVTSVSAAYNHTLAIAGPKNFVYAWGLNDRGEIGNGIETEIGEVGSSILVPTRVELSPGVPLEGVQKVIAVGSAQTSSAEGEVGTQFSLALLESREVYTWGGNDKAELGNGEEEVNKATPQKLLGGFKCVDIAGGQSQGMAIVEGATPGIQSIWAETLGKGEVKLYMKPIPGDRVETWTIEWQREELYPKVKAICSVSGTEITIESLEEVGGNHKPHPEFSFFGEQPKESGLGEGAEPFGTFILTAINQFNKKEFVPKGTRLKEKLSAGFTLPQKWAMTNPANESVSKQLITFGEKNANETYHFIKEWATNQIYKLPSLVWDKNDKNVYMLLQEASKLTTAPSVESPKTHWKLFGTGAKSFKLQESEIKNGATGLLEYTVKYLDKHPVEWINPGGLWGFRAQAEFKNKVVTEALGAKIENLNPGEFEIKFPNLPAADGIEEPLWANQWKRLQLFMPMSAFRPIEGKKYAKLFQIYEPGIGGHTRIYKLGEVVEEPDHEIYICKKTMISSKDENIRTPSSEYAEKGSSSVFWEKGPRYRGIYKNNKEYSIKDVVEFSKNIYEALELIPSSNLTAPVNGTKWRELDSENSPRYKGAWVTKTEYKPTDIVTTGSKATLKLWEALELIPNSNTTAPVAGSKWRLCTGTEPGEASTGWKTGGTTVGAPLTTTSLKGPVKALVEKTGGGCPTYMENDTYETRALGRFEKFFKKREVIEVEPSGLTSIPMPISPPVITVTNPKVNGANPSGFVEPIRPRFAGTPSVLEVTKEGLWAFAEPGFSPVFEWCLCEASWPDGGGSNVLSILQTSTSRTYTIKAGDVAGSGSQGTGGLERCIRVREVMSNAVGECNYWNYSEPSLAIFE